MKQDSTILPFPRSKIVREILPESEELKRLKAKNTRNFADALVQDLSEEILVALSEVGLDTDGENFNKDFHFFVGTLHSMVYRSLDMEHDLHQFVDEKVRIIKTSSYYDEDDNLEVIDEASDFLVDTDE
jgi:hypothetical protein